MSDTEKNQLHTRCTDCDCLLYATQSQEEGLCRECAGDIDESYTDDLEERLEHALK